MSIFQPTRRDIPKFGEQSYIAPQASLQAINGGYLYTSPSPQPNADHTAVDAFRRSASKHPNRLMLADRLGDVPWREISYGEALDKVNAIAQALLDRGFKAGDVVAIVAPNSIEQCLITYGAMTMGATVAPISLSYAMFPEARERLVSTFNKAAPKMLFVQDIAPMEAALADLDMANTELVSACGASHATPFEDLTSVIATDAVDRALAEIQPDWTAKLLFTSGSTGAPKAVINTHRMMTSNMAMMMSVRFRDIAAPNVILDWLPWHHTFGGNVVLAEALADGSSLYIDDGKPIPGPMLQKTIDAIKDIKPTTYNCVPAGLGMLADAMDSDQDLRDAFFSNLNMLRYGGAGLSGPVYEKLQTHAEAATGRRVPAMSAYAMTEAAPAMTLLHWPVDNSACVGVPLPGVEMKLLAVEEGRYEVRVRGDHVFPGYLNEPAANANAFDEEGYFKTGDVCRFIDINDPSAGIAYDGRVSEDFKLETGTWVNVGQIRAQVLEHFGTLFKDLVVAGDRQPYVSVLCWLRQIPEGSEVVDGLVIPSAALKESLLKNLSAWNAQNQASSRRIAKLVLLAEPPSLQSGEVNDKQYINQRAVLAQRAEIVQALYKDQTPADAVVENN